MAAGSGHGQLCPCGLDLNIWQNPWNHEAGCSMQPTTSGLPPAAEPTDGLREGLRNIVDELEDDESIGIPPHVPLLIEALRRSLDVS